VETVTVKAGRTGQLLGAVLGLVMLFVGLALLPRLVGWVALLLGVVGLVAGLGGLLPGAAFVRFSPDGLTVKYAFLRGRTVPWRVISAAASEFVPLIRHQLPALVLTYAEDYTGPRVGQHLDESRSYVANFTVVSGDELAATANEFRERYGAAAEPVAD
jgi:hypothetical protein